MKKSITAKQLSEELDSGKMTITLILNGGKFLVDDGLGESKIIIGCNSCTPLLNAGGPELYPSGNNSDAPLYQIGGITLRSKHSPDITHAGLTAEHVGLIVDEDMNYLKGVSDFHTCSILCRMSTLNKWLSNVGVDVNKDNLRQSLESATDNRLLTSIELASEFLIHFSELPTSIQQLYDKGVEGRVNTMGTIPGWFEVLDAIEGKVTPRLAKTLYHAYNEDRALYVNELDSVLGNPPKALHDARNESPILTGTIPLGITVYNKTFRLARLIDMESHEDLPVLLIQGEFYVSDSGIMEYLDLYREVYVKVSVDDIFCRAAAATLVRGPRSVKHLVPNRVEP